MRSRCVALATLNAALYEELASDLRARRIPAISVPPGHRIPPHAAVVLTSPEEAAQISHRRVVAVSPGSDRTALWASVEHALGPASEGERTIIVGIDPGPRPGYAVLFGDRWLAEGVLDRPEAVGELAGSLRRRFPSHEFLFRVGHGDPIPRDRILNALAPLRRSSEIVDESGTTPRGHRRPRDALAARAIAQSRGRAAAGNASIEVTAGEIANLQRMSREGSNGRFTIPRHEAARVLRGELSLSEALQEGGRRYLPTPAGARGAPRRSEPS